jgi:hypothetical protein
MIGSNVIPFQGGGGLMAPQAPPMMLNPAFQQWMQLKQAWDAENARRQQKFMAACALIKEDAAKSYKIDIEADSTVVADQQAEQAAITEFMRAIIPLSEVLIPQMMQSGPVADFAGALLRFGFRAFPASREMDDALEKFVEDMKRAPPQPPTEGKGKTVAETQMETQLGQAKVAASVHDTQVKAQIAQQESASRVMAAQVEAQADQAKAQAENQLRVAELALRGREVAGREALDAARLTRIGIRNTEGLT